MILAPAGTPDAYPPAPGGLATVPSEEETP
jgi:hypothetical protein